MTFRAMDLMIDAVIREAGGKGKSYPNPCKKCKPGTTLRCDTRPGCRSKSGAPTACNPASTANRCSATHVHENELAMLILDLKRLEILAGKAA